MCSPPATRPAAPRLLDRASRSRRSPRGRTLRLAAPARAARATGACSLSRARRAAGRRRSSSARSLAAARRVARPPARRAADRRPARAAPRRAAGYGLAAAALRPVEAMRARAEAISASTPGARLPVAAGPRRGLAARGDAERDARAASRRRSSTSAASSPTRATSCARRSRCCRPSSSSRCGGRARATSSRQALRSAAEETERLTRLAEDLLLIARADRAGCPIRREQVPARELLDEVAARFAGLARRTRARARGPPAERTRARRRPGTARAGARQPRRQRARARRRPSRALRSTARRRLVELHVVDEGSGLPAGVHRARVRPLQPRRRGAQRRRHRARALDRRADRARRTAARTGAENRAGGGADVWIAVARRELLGSSQRRPHRRSHLAAGTLAAHGRSFVHEPSARARDAGRRPAAPRDRAVALGADRRWPAHSPASRPHPLRRSQGASRGGRSDGQFATSRRRPRRATTHVPTGARRPPLRAPVVTTAAPGRGRPAQRDRRPASVSFPALGTTALLCVTDAAGLPPPQRRARPRAGRARRARAAASATTPSSCALNAAPPGSRLQVGALLCDAVEVALAAARATGGLVDPTVGRSLRLAGYDRRFASVRLRDGSSFRARFAPAPGLARASSSTAARARSACRRASSSTSARPPRRSRPTAARAPRPRASGTRRPRQPRRRHRGRGATPPTAAGRSGSRTTTRRASTQPGPTVAIEGGGLATSGTTVRRWRAGDRRAAPHRRPAHRPAGRRRRGGRSPSPPRPCVDANVASTAAIVLGEQAPAWLAARGLAGAARARRRARSRYAGCLAGGRGVSLVVAATRPERLWYLTRGTGVVALLLLTAGVVLGVLTSTRWAPPRWPRFVVSGLHRNVTLLALAFVAVHVLTTVLDGYAPIRLRDAVSRSPRATGRSGSASARSRSTCCSRSIADEPAARAARLPRVAGRALARLRLVAGRARARARHGQRRAHGLVRPPRPGLGRRRRAGGRAGVLVRGALGRPAGPARRRRGRRCRLRLAIGHLGTGGPLAARLGRAGRHAARACSPLRGQRS